MGLRRARPEKSMLTKNPQRARELHPLLNREKLGNLDAASIYPYPDQKLYWFCFECNNTYLSSRGKKTGCNNCGDAELHIDGRNSIVGDNPRMMFEFHPTLNGMNTPENIFAGHKTPYWYVCISCSHIHRSNGPNKRYSALSCENCGARNQFTGNTVHIDGRNSVASNPRLDLELHPTHWANPNPPANASMRSKDEYLWVCVECKDSIQCNNLWLEFPNERKSGGRKQNCTNCGSGVASHVHIDGRDSLQESAPFSHLSFHPTLNKGYTPDLVKKTHKIVGSGRGAKEGDSFEPYWCCPICMDVKQRRVGEHVKRGCTSCEGVDWSGRAKKVTIHVDGRNSVFNQRPDVISQIHPIMNQEVFDLSKLTLGSNKPFWYLCHFCLNPWYTTIASRCLRNSECPVCAPRGYNPDEPGFYYVFAVSRASDFLHFKAGISNNWRRRRGELIRSHNEIFEEEFEYTLVSLAYFEQMRTAGILESMMKAQAQSYGWHIDPEQFDGIDGQTERFSTNPLENAREINPFVRTLIEGSWTEDYRLSDLEVEHEDVCSISSSNLD